VRTNRPIALSAGTAPIATLSLVHSIQVLLNPSILISDRALRDEAIIAKAKKRRRSAAIWAI